MCTDNFQKWLKGIFDKDLEKFLNHPNLPTFIRVNLLKTNPQLLQEVLKDYGAELEAFPSLPAFKITSHREDAKPGVWFHHFLGHYLIQSLGSMIPPLILDPQPGERILDLCAAPGSKSTQMAAMMQGKGELWLNELVGRRMNPLASAIDAIGAWNTHMIQSPGERLPNRLKIQFDRILVDVPCSGLGVKENLKSNRHFFEKRRGKPDTLPSLQYRLLLSAIKMLKVGGTLVYSTCSLNPEEDEGVVHQVLERLPMRLLDINPIQGLKLRRGRLSYQSQVYHPEVEKSLRITPYENPTEGFFVALLKKTAPLEARFEAQNNPHFEEEKRPTLTLEDEPISTIVEKISKLYGIPIEIFQPYRFLEHKNERLTILDPQIKWVWTQSARSGLTLARRRGPWWRLNHSAIQILAPYIVQNRVDLSHRQWIELVEKGETTLFQSTESPYPALSSPWIGPFASGIAEGKRLRWKRPRRYVLPDHWK